MTRKEKKKQLAITEGQSKSTDTSTSGNASSGDCEDKHLNEASINIPVYTKGSGDIDTSPFLSKVLTDTSLESASQENRRTPIDFSTSEVRSDDDLNGINSQRITFSPSPVPEVSRYSSSEAVSNCLDQNLLQSPSSDNSDPSSILSSQLFPKPIKLAEVYNCTDTTHSTLSSSNNGESTRNYNASFNTPIESISYHNHLQKKLNSSIVGGSLRQLKARRSNVSFPNSSSSGRILQLERRNSDQFRLRKRVDTSRRDAVEAGFEPREDVPRCHSVQSLKDVHRSKSYNKSQFQASDLSLNPNGRVIAPCDSTTINLAPTATVNPAHHRLSKVHSRSTYDYQQDQMNEDRRRSLHTLAGASSLYQLSNGRSQFSPSVDMQNQSQGTRIRVSSQSQICDTNPTPHYSVDQRRSVHNISNPVRSSFVDGIKTTSTPKNQIAVAPLAHKQRHLSESRDEMRSDRRASGAGMSMNLPAFQNYLSKHPNEERLVDGPVTTPSEARIAYLETRIRELENRSTNGHLQSPSVHSTPVQNRTSRSSNFHNMNGSMLMNESSNLQSLNDELNMNLMAKDKKITNIEGKLLKAYQRIERQHEEYEMKINSVLLEGEMAKNNLKDCISKIHELEGELDGMKIQTHQGNYESDKSNQEMRDRLWKQDRELQENRVMIARLREKEAEYEKMRSEKGMLELKNENLNKKLELKKRAVEELERSVSTLRLEQTICQQSCSSGSTPLADECETMSDIRPSIARPYTKAHSTLGSNMSPLPHSKSTGLTKSFSNFALNSSKRDDITPMMSRSIREQNRHITMCRAMVVCLKDTVERLANGENPDVAELLGVKINMSESELDEDDDYEADESKPFSMMAAESVLHKQCQKLVELDKGLDTIRMQLAEWHTQVNGEGEGDREVCRVQ